MKPRSLRAAAALGAAMLLVASGCIGVEPDPLPGGVGTWRRIASAPTARQEVAAAAVGDEVVVAGGLLASGRATDLVEIYNTKTDTWTRGPRLPIAVHHAMAAELFGELYVIGGFTGTTGVATDRVFIISGGPTGRQETPLPGPPRVSGAAGWQEGPRLSHARAAGAAVGVRGEVVVVGGIASGKHVAPTEIFDWKTRQWEDGADIPSPRDHLAAATDFAYVYTAGGRRSGGHFAEFERYDPVEDAWKTLRPLPTARSGLGAASVGRRIVTVGGEGPRIFPEVEAYDTLTGTWARLPDMPTARHGVGVVAVERKVYALAGGDAVGLASTDVCEALDLSAR